MKNRVSSIAIVLAAVGLSACLMNTEEEWATESTGVATSAINNGTVTSARPEVANYTTGIGSCTATLIAPRFALAAGHCTLGYPVPIRNGQFLGQEVTEVFVFGAGPEVTALVGAFNMDVSVFRLQNNVTTVSPAKLGTALPGSSTYVTQIGFGCDSDGTPTGTKQYRSFYYPTSGVTCPGDSGGPMFLGSLYSYGAILGVASSFGANDYGNVPMFREDVAAVMRYYEGGFEPGVNRVGWDIGGSITKTSKDACMTACIGNSSCRAFTWIAGSNQCWLKSTLARWEGTSNTNYVSGVVMNSNAESNTDRMGSDYTSHTASASQCRLDCERDRRCKAYTYYGGTCYLKSAAGDPTYLAGAVSAVRRGPDQLYKRRNGTIIQTVEVDYPQPEECAARCANNASCQSWNYRRPMVGLPAQCELMSNAPTPTSDSLHSTGTRYAAFY